LIAPLKAAILPGMPIDQGQPVGGTYQALFYILASTGQCWSWTWGFRNDVIVAGDYDGDGKIDLAVVRASGGVIHWYIVST
jgi:hypothetical protein